MHPRITTSYLIKHSKPPRLPKLAYSTREEREASWVRQHSPAMGTSVKEGHNCQRASKVIRGDGESWVAVKLQNVLYQYIHPENGFVCTRNEDASRGYSLIGRVSAEHGQSPGFDPETAWARHGGTCLQSQHSEGGDKRIESPNLSLVTSWRTAKDTSRDCHKQNRKSKIKG